MKCAAMSRVSRLALRLLGRLRHLARHRADVVDHVGQRRARAAVDAGMVDLRVEADLVVLHALEHIELPQRTRAVEKLGMHPADGALEDGAAVRRRQAGAEDVAVDVELIVLDPARVIDVQRRLRQPRLQDRRDVQAAGDHRLEVFEEVALIAVLQPEDRHAADMHRHLRRLEIEEGGVNRRQFARRVAHGPSREGRSVRRLWRRFVSGCEFAFIADADAIANSARSVKGLRVRARFDRAEQFDQRRARSRGASTSLCGRRGRTCS